MIDKYKEVELLRMTKDELIEHIFVLYDVYHCKYEELEEWYTVSEKIQELRKKQFGDEWN